MFGLKIYSNKNYKYILTQEIKNLKVDNVIEIKENILALFTRKDKSYHNLGPPETAHICYYKVSIFNIENRRRDILIDSWGWYDYD